MVRDKISEKKDSSNGNAIDPYSLSITDNIIRVKIFNIPQTESIIMKQYEEILELANRVSGKVNLLYDLRKAGKPTAGARKKLVENSKDKKFGKIAIFGASTLIKTVATFIINASGLDTIRHFPNEEEALQWFTQS
ncbi:hypothetical protein COB64_00425 [Candidatus Wolfebacteria bacterium]|nr:MAG: hypothetical protein COB64_00425 [Candidatus Wolfebacteria bacterium]